ncbi:serine/threonine-protein kinase/endoribonuclease IRE1a [Artemisia annua]|uniref:Serine/threonine-protein kinase/endoribonuclease IRE1a n=1 Tax=Artemisia annua TaxID=35608 RepID=A0A2U1QCI3_ARTAN|nr:serine/threonine-protein kinase/endoribonuclease IRE1a [Artemisia annua]
MEKNHVIVLEGVKENRIILGWDLENSVIQKIDEFVKYLKDEIAKAFPGVDVDIHAFVVKGIEGKTDGTAGKTDGTAGKTDGTASMRKKCDLNESIVCHWLEPGIGNDRADYEMMEQRVKLMEQRVKLMEQLAMIEQITRWGLIRGVAYMQELPFAAHMWGNISASSVVITGADLGQVRLKIFIPGLGVGAKTKRNDRKGLAEIINRFKAVFPIPEFQDLVQCLRKNERDDLKSLIEHPIFWTAFEKLDFFVNVFEVVRENETLRSALSNIKQVVENSQTGSIDFEFFLAMESYATYAQGFYSSKVGQLVRMIRHSKIHDLDLPDDVRKLYGKSRVGLEKYYRDRYPNLFFEIYKLVQKICRKHDHFAQFTILEP